MEATHSPRAIRGLFWGNRVGKTEWGAQEVVRYILGEHPTRQILPPIEVWCACPSYDQQKETTQKKLEAYLPKHRIADVTFVKKNTWGEIILDNGSRVNFKSYEQGREKFQGVGKRLIWFDEEPPHDIWEECFVRTEAGIPLDILLTMTPINGMTWAYDDVYLATGNDDIFVSTAGWDDNPFLTEPQKAQMARGLSAESMQVRKYGKFIKRVGLVCDWWQRDKHVIDITNPDPEWHIYRAADFGYSAYNAIVYVGVDRENNWYVFDGIYQRGLTTPELGSIIREHDKGRFITNAWADAAGAQNIADLRAEDISFRAVQKRPKVGIEDWDEYRAQVLASHGKVDKATGRPKLFIASHLTHFDDRLGKEVNWAMQEIEGLRWAENISSDGSRSTKPRWGDQAKHFIDALSYFAVSVDNASVTWTAIEVGVPKVAETAQTMTVSEDERKRLEREADLLAIRQQRGW